MKARTASSESLLRDSCKESPAARTRSQVQNEVCDVTHGAHGVHAKAGPEEEHHSSIKFLLRTVDVIRQSCMSRCESGLRPVGTERFNVSSIITGLCSFQLFVQAQHIQNALPQSISVLLEALRYNTTSHSSCPSGAEIFFQESEQDNGGGGQFDCLPEEVTTQRAEKVPEL